MQKAMSMKISGVMTAMAEFKILKSGSFCFWGEWFGRPLDNSHKCVSASLDGDVLMAEFADGESLSVYGAKGVFSDEGRFYIKDAELVLWEWDLYDEPPGEDSRRFIEYKKLPDGSILRTSDLGSGNEIYLSSEGKKAVELC